MKMKIAAALASAVLLSTTAHAAQSKSPIFGDASVATTSVEKNKTIIGKGAYSDYYGYYGNLYNNYAGLYGLVAAYVGEGSTKTNYYYYAYSYASSAATNYYYAYYYAYYGY